MFVSDDTFYMHGLFSQPVACSLCSPTMLRSLWWQQHGPLVSVTYNLSFA